VRAVATFESRKGRARDRKAAKTSFGKAIVKISAASLALEGIATNREFSQFLEDIYRAVVPRENRRSKPSKKLSSRQAFDAAVLRSQQELENYREIAPDTLANHLTRLQSVLEVAAERVDFQPGEFQRDEYAQELCDDLAFAWISGTGELPTFSQSNPRSRSKSTFAELLSLVNGSILDPRFRNKTDFRSYGDKARDTMQERYPELDVRGQPSRRHQGNGP